jgi:hypothetical protein
MGPDDSELEITSFVLQKAAEYLSRLTDKDYTPSNLDEARDIRGLEAEYYVLRTALVSARTVYFERVTAQSLIVTNRRPVLERKPP